MKTSVFTKDGAASSESVCAKKTTKLTIPIRDELSDLEGVALGLRQEMFSVGEPTCGSVTCGAGYGTDFIILEWNGRRAVVRGSELFKAWVKTFDPKNAARLP